LAEFPDKCYELPPFSLGQTKRSFIWAAYNVKWYPGEKCYISIVEIPQIIKLQTRKVDSLSLSHNKEILNINVKEECFNRFLL
jgi:hypothetical protein